MSTLEHLSSMSTLEYTALGAPVFVGIMVWLGVIWLRHH